MTLQVIEPLHDSVATAHAKAHKDAVKSHSHANVALACRVPTISADSHPIPERVATAERISQRFASDIVPLQESVASAFFHHARFPLEIDHAHKILKPAPSHHAFGASIQV